MRRSCGVLPARLGEEVVDVLVGKGGDETVAVDGQNVCTRRRAGPKPDPRGT
jgi:hypothetical protein